MITENSRSSLPPHSSRVSRCFCCWPPHRRACAQAGRGGINGTGHRSHRRRRPRSQGHCAQPRHRNLAIHRHHRRRPLLLCLPQPRRLRVTASRKGFESVAQDNVAVTVDQVTAVNIALQVGSVNEVVTVSAVVGHH